MSPIWYPSSQHRLARFCHARGRVLGFAGLLVSVLALLIAGPEWYATGTERARGSAETPTVAPTFVASAKADAVADTFVQSGRPTTNYGTKLQIQVEGSPEYIALLRFPTISLPEGAEVTRALLRLRVAKGSATGFQVREVIGAWSESKVTYATRPSTSWFLADSGPTVTGTIIGVPLRGFRADGLSVALFSLARVRQRYVSREGGWPAQLVLEYTVEVEPPPPNPTPEPTPTPSDSPSQSPSPAPTDEPSPTATDPLSPTPSEAPEPSPSDPPGPSPSSDPPPPPPPAPPGTYPPPSTESSFGRFRVECLFSHRAQVDPIVKPGPKGTLSAHMHDFLGNTSTDSDSTYGSMLAAGTTCGLSTDTAGYWVPSLVGPDGAFVEPDRMIIYYRNRPIDYGTTTPFPPDFRMIAGGIGTYPHAYWTCEGQSDSSLETRAQTPPDCGTARLKLHVYFPSCWDGVNIDSTNHRSHVAYAFDESDGTSTDISDDMCPASHPVKIPQVHLRVIFPVSNGPQYRLSDGTLAPHADFWNTWNQAELERQVRDCLHAGVNCELLED